MEPRTFQEDTSFVTHKLVYLCNDICNVYFEILLRNSFHNKNKSLFWPILLIF